MKNQALYSSKDKSKKIKCRLLGFLFGAFARVYFRPVPPNMEAKYKVDKF